MRKITNKRLGKLDEAISIYCCMKKNTDDVIIIMSPDIFSEMLAVVVASSFVMLTMDSGEYSGAYKGLKVIFNDKEDFIAVAYINITSGKTHHIREIKEADNAI